MAAEEPLARVGFSVRSSTSIPGVKAPVYSDSPGLVLLEWVGAEHLRAFLRSLSAPPTRSQTRVILVTDEAAREQAAQAWDFGIDDCLVHPFGSAELLARVRAALQRPATAMSECVSAGPLVLNKASHQVRVDGQTLELAPTEFRLLRFLLEHQGRVFSRQELLHRAWGNNVHAGPRTVEVHVRRLRQVLEPSACDSMIQTVRGFGYRLRMPEDDL